MGERFPKADGRIDDGERIVTLIVGIGATGISTINCLIRSGMPYAEFLAVDMVPQNLEKVLDPAKSIYITPEGAESAIHEAVQASFADISKQGCCEGWLVIIASLDDETGTVFAPVVARVAKELRTLGVISIVTIPLSEELMPAVSVENCLNALRCHVDVLLPFPIDSLSTDASATLSSGGLHAQAETLLSHATKGIVEPFAYTNYITYDPGDFCLMFGRNSVVVMGVGTAGGEGSGLAATKKALADPMLAGVLPYAGSVFVNITGWNMLEQFTAVFETVAAACCDETNIAFMDCNLEGMGEKLRVTIFAGSDAVPSSI